MGGDNSQRATFLMEAYKSRIQFFSEHANRTWTRFNILLTVELALSGLAFNIWFEKGAAAASLWLLPAFGIAVSIIWYVSGVQDRCAYLGYREQITRDREDSYRRSRCKGLTSVQPARDENEEIRHTELEVGANKPEQVARTVPPPLFPRLGIGFISRVPVTYALIDYGAPQPNNGVRPTRDTPALMFFQSG